MKTMIINVPKEVSEKIEALQYDAFSRRDIITYMLSTDYSTESTSFKKYHDEYLESYIKYETSKDELQKLIVEPAVDGKLINWNLEFSTSQVTIEYEQN